MVLVVTDSYYPLMYEVAKADAVTAFTGTCAVGIPTPRPGVQFPISEYSDAPRGPEGMTSI
jgi:hypothetical protein